MGRGLCAFAPELNPSRKPIRNEPLERTTMKCQKCESMKIKLYRQTFRDGSQHALAKCQKCGFSKNVASEFLKFCTEDFLSKKALRENERANQMGFQL
jgi:transcription elongation factor Elf1